MNLGTLRIDVHLFSESEAEVQAQLHRLGDKISYLTELIKQEITKMSQELDALTTQVTENTSVEGSAVLLLQGLSAQIAAIKDDPVKLAALSTSLKTSAQALADAITANTPAA